MTNDEGNHMPNRPSQNFFHREDDGSVRLRLRFADEQASLYEEAAGKTPLMIWINRTLGEAAKRQVKATRAKLAKLPPPQ